MASVISGNASFSRMSVAMSVPRQFLAIPRCSLPPHSIFYGSGRSGTKCPLSSSAATTGRSRKTGNPARPPPRSIRQRRRWTARFSTFPGSSRRLDSQHSPPCLWARGDGRDRAGGEKRFFLDAEEKKQQRLMTRRPCVRLVSITIGPRVAFFSPSPDPPVGDGLKLALSAALSAGSGASE